MSDSSGRGGGSGGGGGGGGGFPSPIPPPPRHRGSEARERVRSRRDARVLEVKGGVGGGARERSSSLPKFVIQHPSPDRSSVESQGNAENRDSAPRGRPEMAKNLSKSSLGNYQTPRSSDSFKSCGSSSTRDERPSSISPSNPDHHQPGSDAEVDSPRIPFSNKGRGSIGGHSSDDASTSSGPGINFASIEGNKRATNKVEQWLRKASQKKDEIAKEQKQRDENVNEYLRMAQNADKAQLPRLKAIFEKRNMKHNVEIQKSQRELEKYMKKVEDLTGTPPSQAAMKKAKDGVGGAGAGPAAAPSKAKDTNLIDNLGQGLKSVGANIREGITDLGGSVINKPREIATSINSALRHKRFGSADNIHQLDEGAVGDVAAPAEDSRSATGRRPFEHHLVVDASLGGAAGSSTTPTPHALGASSSAQGLSADPQQARAFPTNFASNSQVGGFGPQRQSDDENSSLNSGAESLGGAGSLGGGNGAHSGAFRHVHSASPQHKPTFYLGQEYQGFSSDLSLEVFQRLTDIQLELRSLKEQQEVEVGVTKAETAKLQDEMAKIQQHLEEQLREAQYRYERLEELMNDSAELHRNELLNLKQDLTQFAVKEELERVEYRSRERSDELNEQLEACDNRVQRMEKQAQDAQMLTLEGLEATSLSSLPKLINIVLQLLGLVIVILNTACSVVMPFLKTRVRLLTTIVIVAAFVILHHQRNFMWSILSQIINEYRHLTAIQ